MLYDIIVLDDFDPYKTVNAEISWKPLKLKGVFRTWSSGVGFNLTHSNEMIKKTEEILTPKP